MNTILTVFKKELKDTLRDRRTLISAIIMPALLIPVLMYGGTIVVKKIMEKEENKKLKIALINPPAELVASIDTASFEIKDGYTEREGEEAIKSDSLDAMLRFTTDFLAQQEKMESPRVVFSFKKTNVTVEDRMTKVVDDYSDKLLKTRIETLGLTSATIKPINLKNKNVAEPKELFGKTVGGMLPYMFIIFCFMGCMYPALDLVTGEKERGTIETLLTVPASRFKILCGKVLTISLVGLASAVMGIVGMFIGVKILPDLPPMIAGVMNTIISPKTVVMMLAMLLPLCVFFAGVLSAMVVKAKSFKEAQSIVSPFMTIMIIPAAMAMLPGIEMNWTTAMIPILNIGLATKEIIAGTMQYGHFIAIVVSLIVLAIISVIISYKQFSKEGMVLK